MCLMFSQAEHTPAGKQHHLRSRLPTPSLSYSCPRAWQVNSPWVTQRAEDIPYADHLYMACKGHTLHFGNLHIVNRTSRVTGPAELKSELVTLLLAGALGLLTSAGGSQLEQKYCVAEWEKVWEGS